MRWKGLIITLFVGMTVAAAAAVPEPKDVLSHIKFGKCRIVSIVPTGLRSVRAGVELEARNDTSAFTLQDVRLALFRKGEPFAEGVCEEVSVPKGASKVRVTGDFELCDEVSLWSAVSTLRNADLSEFTGNVDLTVVSGKGRKYAYSEKNLSMGSLGVPTTDRKVEGKADAKVASSEGKVPSGIEQVTVPDKRVEPTPKQADQPAASKQKKARKRPWWQFWKK